MKRKSRTLSFSPVFPNLLFKNPGRRAEKTPALNTVYSSCTPFQPCLISQYFLSWLGLVLYFHLPVSGGGRGRFLVESAGSIEKAFGDGAVHRAQGMQAEGPLPVFPVFFFSLFYTPWEGVGAGGRQCQVHARTTTKLRHKDKTGSRGPFWKLAPASTPDCGRPRGGRLGGRISLQPV